MLLVFGHWSHHVSVFPLWVDLKQRFAIHVDPGLAAALLMLTLSLHGLTRTLVMEAPRPPLLEVHAPRARHTVITIVTTHALTVGYESRALGLDVIGR